MEEEEEEKPFDFTEEQILELIDSGITPDDLAQFSNLSTDDLAQFENLGGDPIEETRNILSPLQLLLDDSRRFAESEDLLIQSLLGLEEKVNSIEIDANKLYEETWLNFLIYSGSANFVSIYFQFHEFIIFLT